MTCSRHAPVHTMTTSMSYDQLIALCKDPDRKERMKSVTKETIADLIISNTTDDVAATAEPDGLNRCLVGMAQEIRSMKVTMERVTTAIENIEGIKEELIEMKKENAEIKEKLKQQGMIIKHHQAFMERVDTKERGCNLIIMGITEGSVNDDVTKTRATLTVLDTDVDSDVKNIKRLGVRETNKNRPILVELTSMEERNRIVDAARGNGAEELEGIRIKKDVHPSVRAEWRRLFQVKEEEEKKAANAGCTITIDIRKRQVLRDGQVIDSWCNQLF